jgi:hypothetical protein
MVRDARRGGCRLREGVGEPAEEGKREVSLIFWLLLLLGGGGFLAAVAVVIWLLGKRGAK